MPFKIIQTIERGKERLTIVPSNWEHNGILRWPGKNVPLKLLIKNEESKPLPDWSEMECIVKRSYIPSYNKAEEILEIMLNCSETSDYPDDESRVIIQSPVDYNSKAANLMLQQQHVEKSMISNVENNISSQDIVQDNEVGEVGETVFQIITNDQLNNTDKILENQKEIIYNQTQILEKLKKNSRQISDLTVLIEESFKRLAGGNQNLPVVKLAEANYIESESFMIKPISDANELNDLEINLSDYRTKQKLHFQYALLCNKSDGSGISCAYKLLDIMFTREFLCKCSWSGGSKGKLVKVAFKAYKNILNFFFSLINSWDSTYTHDTNEKFFKTVLKNSGKRLEIKNLRTSTKRTRNSTQKCTITKRAKVEENEIVEDGIKEPPLLFHLQQFRSSEEISENNSQEPENDMSNSHIQNQILGNDESEEESLC